MAQAEVSNANSCRVPLFSFNVLPHYWEEETKHVRNLCTKFLALHGPRLQVQLRQESFGRVFSDRIIQ